MKKLLIAGLLVSSVLSAPISAGASGGGARLEPKQQVWPFDGVLGTVDRPAAQRGYQVFKQVCSACHSMHGLSYRNLAEIGFSEAEVKAIAAEYKVMDGPNDNGEMFERPARPSDRFVKAFPNEKAARAANGGAYPPDLTLIAKARHDGPNYIYSLITGYKDAPAEITTPEGKYYNPYFGDGQWHVDEKGEKHLVAPGGFISMAPPLSEGAVTYADGTAATPDQMAKDVVTFLQWAAEPEMEARKSMGLKVLIFVGIATAVAYAAMKRIWARIK